MVTGVGRVKVTNHHVSTAKFKPSTSDSKLLLHWEAMRFRIIIICLMVAAVAAIHHVQVVRSYGRRLDALERKSEMRFAAMKVRPSGACPYVIQNAGHSPVAG